MVVISSVTRWKGRAAPTPPSFQRLSAFDGYRILHVTETDLDHLPEPGANPQPTLQETPMFADQVKSGALPPIGERVPCVHPGWSRLSPVETVPAGRAASSTRAGGQRAGHVADDSLQLHAPARGDGAAHRRLLGIVDAEVRHRGLRATKGGSFGFRGHRYELIEPDHEDGVPFLRVALGFRGGRTLDELIALVRELASRPRLEN